MFFFSYAISRKIVHDKYLSFPFEKILHSDNMENVNGETNSLVTRHEKLSPGVAQAKAPTSYRRDKLASWDLEQNQTQVSTYFQYIANSNTECTIQFLFCIANFDRLEKEKQLANENSSEARRAFDQVNSEKLLVDRELKSCQVWPLQQFLPVQGLPHIGKCSEGLFKRQRMPFTDIGIAL